MSANCSCAQPRPTTHVRMAPSPRTLVDSAERVRGLGQGKGAGHMAAWKPMKMAAREWQRHCSRAIRKSWIRALAELITNADDSYARLEKRGVATTGSIVVEFVRSSKSGSFRIIDQAEGMQRE